MDDAADTADPILNAILYRDARQLYVCRLDNTLELGRRETFEPPAPAVVDGKSGHRKLIVAEIDLAAIPRSFAMLERLPGNQLAITNIHRANSFSVAGLGVIEAKQSIRANVPLTLILPGGFTLAVVEEQHAFVAGSPSAADGMSLRSRPRVPSENVESLQSSRSHAGPLAEQSNKEKSILGSLLNAPTNRLSIDATEFLEVLDFVVLSAQKPATSAAFYKGIAEAVTRFIDMDRAEVVLWNGHTWERSSERIYCTPSRSEMASRAPSYSVLDRSVASKQIVAYPDDTFNFGTESVRELVAAIACPILDENEVVLGALYADRVSDIGSATGKVTRIEEKLIEILATAIATGIAKTKRESLVTTYQQFFSSKVIEAIRLDPKILSGENCDVTVLFCDIRGFSRITDRIGPASAMKWIQDTLSELSDHVQGLEGVLVDYVGDELFAMWGAPDKQPHHAFCAASAASKMMTLAVELSARWRESIPEGFEFGIGLCTGPAQVGNTGSRQKFKYGPMGRTVNLGSRIQGLTSHWRVQTLMNESTAQRLPADIPKRRICQAKVKGMDGNVTIYELVPDREKPFEDLHRDYESALLMFEQGEHREAARAFGDLVKRYPKDGPSLVMLVRAVQQVAEPTENFDPVWIAPSK